MADPIFSVSQISDYIENKLLLDAMLVNVSVRGEVTNYSESSKGQIYFSIKDDAAQVNCILFDRLMTEETFQNGAMVIVTGEIGYYKKAGRINLVVKRIKTEGQGDLFAQYLETKARLEAEGMFDFANKKPLPRFPFRVGVITSGAGAVMHDIIKVATRRFDGITIIVYPSSVQGLEAPAQLTEGILYFNQSKAVDLIIIGRGGGSFEDLFAFNDEALARTIFNSVIPVVSAVGHEVDYTICDFVSDFRAPTPSAAAELCIPQKADIEEMIIYMRERLGNLLSHELARAESSVTHMRLRMTEASPSEQITNRMGTAIRLRQALINQMEAKCQTDGHRLTETREKLTALSPLNILSRGYAFITGTDHAPIRRAEDLKTGDRFGAVFADGRIEAEVTAEKKEASNE